MDSRQDGRSAAPEPEMIDWGRVAELRSEIGEEGLSEVVGLFLEEVEAVLGRLTRGGSGRTLEEEMHFLKGSAWNLGFSRFGAVAQQGERRAAAGDPDPVQIPEVIETYARSLEAFMQRIGSFCPDRNTGGPH